MSNRTIQWGGVAGMTFVVLILITVFGVSQPPAADDAADKIRTYLTDHRSTLLAFNAIGLIAIPFVLWFAVVLRDVLRGDATTNALGTASLAGLLVTAPMAMAGGAVSVAPTYLDGAAKTLGDDTLRLAFEAQNLLFAATSAGLVMFALGSALAIQRTRALPTYTMWLAGLAVVGNVVAMFATLGAGVAALGLAGVLTFALFVLVTGITMAAGKATPAAAT